MEMLERSPPRREAGRKAVPIQLTSRTPAASGPGRPDGGHVGSVDIDQQPAWRRATPLDVDEATWDRCLDTSLGRLDDGAGMRAPNDPGGKGGVIVHRLDHRSAEGHRALRDLKAGYCR
jgi:hypothetical protein